MSEKKITLALAFLQQHPDSAAAILEQHEIPSVATFLSGIPHSYSAPVLQQMLPHYAVRVCETLTRELAVNILSYLEMGQIAAILRYLDKDRRQTLLQDLPSKTQIGCSLLLNYSNEVVGAWITPQMATIPHDCSAGEALNFLKVSPDVVHTDFIYAVTRDRNLKGRIPLVDLLKATVNTPLSNLTKSCKETLSARTRIQQAATHGDWKKFHEIPVINRNQKFIGVLRQIELRKALDHLAPETDSKSPIHSINSVGKIYGESLLALFDSMKQIVEADIRSQ